MYPIETSDKLFRDGNGTSELGTVLPAWWLNQIQAELIGILEAAKLSPEKNNQNQVRRAIEKLIGDEVGKIQEANNQADGGNVKTTGNQNVNGTKTFLSQMNAANGLSVSDTKALLDSGNMLNFGANANGGYLFNKKSGKELRLANNGSLLYDGSDIITARKVSHSPDDYTVATVPSSFALNKAFDNSIKRGGAIGLGGAAHQIAIGWDTPGLVAKVDNNVMNVGVPVGTVAYFAQDVPPFGWLKANGAAVSRTVYANLFAAIGERYGRGDGRTTFNLPDLRGEFVRGFDDGRNIDRSRALGSAQNQSMADHYHGIGVMNSTDDMVIVNQSWSGGGNEYPVMEMAGEYNRVLKGRISSTRLIDGGTLDEGGRAYAPGNGSPFHSGLVHHIATAIQDLSGNGSETRPRNVALLACIKI